MTATVHAPRPPEGDWLGTPFLKFERQGPFGVVTLDRPKARNAMSPAMTSASGMRSTTLAPTTISPG
jgi:hypothetical protein